MKTKILSMVICIILLVSLSSCGKKDILVELDNALSASLESPSQLFPDEKTPEFLAYIEQNNSYEILSYEDKGEVIASEIKITSPDLYSAAKSISLDDSVTNENQANTLLVDKLGKLPKIEKTVKIEFTFTDSEYRPVLTDEFLDAYYGGAFHLREDMIQDLIDEEGNK